MSHSLNGSATFRLDDAAAAYAKRRGRRTEHVRRESMTFPRLAAWRYGHARGRGSGVGYTPGGREHQRGI